MPNPDFRAENGGLANPTFRAENWDCQTPHVGAEKRGYAKPWPANTLKRLSDMKKDHQALLVIL